MKRLILLFIIFICVNNYTKAQQVENIYFHLYTDSLKKGVYNYINVDGKMSDGSWLPLDDKQILFSSSAGKWDGNNLILDAAYNKDSVMVTAVLKANKQLQKKIVIYMKRQPDNEHLKTEQEIMNEMNTNNKKKSGKG